LGFGVGASFSLPLRDSKGVLLDSPFVKVSGLTFLRFSPVSSELVRPLARKLV
jgi:hypothetical protein